MENISIRNYIIENLKNDNAQSIKECIETTIKTKNEDALIGLGVLFELYWKTLNDDEKTNYTQILANSLKDN